MRTGVQRAHALQAAGTSSPSKYTKLNARPLSLAAKNVAYDILQVWGPVEYPAMAFHVDSGLQKNTGWFILARGYFPGDPFLFFLLHPSIC